MSGYRSNVDRLASECQTEAGCRTACVRGVDASGGRHGGVGEVAGVRDPVTHIPKQLSTAFAHAVSGESALPCMKTTLRGQTERANGLSRLPAQTAYSCSGDRCGPGNLWDSDGSRLSRPMEFCSRWVARTTRRETCRSVRAMVFQQCWTVQIAREAVTSVLLRRQMQVFRPACGHGNCHNRE